MKSSYSTNGFSSEERREESYQTNKLPLKLVMDPRGQMIDFSTSQKPGYRCEQQMMSPEICAEVVNALHAPRGKGLLIPTQFFWQI